LSRKKFKKNEKKKTERNVRGMQSAKTKRGRRQQQTTLKRELRRRNRARS
jgi:hypothetical protein